MKTFKAKEIVVPSNLAELYDSSTGAKAGTLRNMLAEEGRLRDIDHELLAIGLMPNVEAMLKMDKLPMQAGKGMTLDRFSTVIWALMFAYCLGTFKINDKTGIVLIGDDTDVEFAMSLMTVDKIKFRNGKSMDKKDFMRKLNIASENDVLSGIYSRIIKRHGFLALKKEPKGVDLHDMALLAMKVADGVMNGEI